MNVADDGRADPSFVRSLGGAEQGLDLMEMTFASCHSVRVIIYEGTFDAELFQRALHQLVQRRPLLNTRIVRPAGETPYFARSPQWPAVAVVERADGEHWRTEFERQMSTPVGVADDPVLSLRVLAGDGRGEVVLSCHHGVCDGRSLTGFCRDLIHEYEWLQRGAPGDPEAVAGAVSPPLEEVLPPGLTGPARQQVVEAYVAHVTKLMRSRPGFFLEAGSTTVTPAARRLLTYELTPVQTDALASLAHANGTTIGGAISAAVLRAGVDLGGPDVEDELGLVSNIDLRPYLRERVPLSNMGLYASALLDSYPGIRTKPLWELARDVTDDIRSSIDSLQAYCSMLMAKHMFPMVQQGQLPIWPQFQLANLGRVDLPTATESFRVRSIHGGVPVYVGGPTLFCSAVGLSSKIVIDVNYQAPDVADDVAHAFGASLLDHLTTKSGAAAVQSSSAEEASQGRR